MSDAKSDLSPPRYKQVGGWRHIICDEMEWLARPSGWGIGELPLRVRRRKQKLYDFYQHVRSAQFLACGVCRPLVADLFTEDGVDPDRVAPNVREWYGRTHPAGEPKCDAWPVWRVVINYRRGILDATEVRNGVFNNLHDAVYTPLYTRAGIERWNASRAEERTLALELIGPNPFRPIPFLPEWRTDTVMSLARQMYESRDFGAMPILADALQDAGCDDEAILSHCRDASAAHVRGCWVVDLVLGKR